MIDFRVSILNYRHSYELGEIINIGALIYNVNEPRLEFLYPKKLQRLSSLYTDISIATIRNYLKDFENQSNKISHFLNNKKSQLLGLDRFDYDLEKLPLIIENEFLKTDSTSFYFSEMIKGATEDFSSVINYYRQRLDNLYELDSSRSRKDEEYIIKSFESVFKERKSLKSNIQKDILLTNEFFSEEFKYGWKNGRFNLITPVSFDLSQSKTIDDKACKWHGKLDSFQKKALDENLNFDILVTKPNDRSLIKNFNNAINYLNTITTPKRILFEDELDDYVKDAESYFNN